MVHKLGFASAAVACGIASWSVKLAAEEASMASRPDGPSDAAPRADEMITDAALALSAPAPAARDSATTPAVSVSKTHPMMLAGTGLDDEQKLQVALCRRQAWVRAAQAGPLLGFCCYAVAVVADRTRLGPLPRGSRFAAPLAGCVVGMMVGSFVGGSELKGAMNQALLDRPIAGAHLRGAARAESVGRAAAETERRVAAS